MSFVAAWTKQLWTQRHNDELVEKSNKDSRHFWKVYKARKRDSCPVSLPEQKEAFQTLYGAQPAEPPQRPAASGVSPTSNTDDECMFAGITAEELHVCVQELKRGKSPGIDGVSADMVIDGGDCSVWDAHMGSVIPLTTTAVPFYYNWFRILKLVA